MRNDPAGYLAANLRTRRRFLLIWPRPTMPGEYSAILGFSFLLLPTSVCGAVPLR